MASEIDLREEDVLDAARKLTGLDDFGDPAFREGLRVLLATYALPGRFSERGRKRAFRRIAGLLATRLRVEAAWQAHPEIRQRVLRAPLVLTGLPRSGTSALFNLLACDPDARPLWLWEALNPDPCPLPLAPGEVDPRRAAVAAGIAKGQEQNPDFAKIHAVAADRPEECVLLMAHAFCDVQLGIEPMLEPYASWFRRQDFRAMYRYYADLLRLLDWQRPGRRWLLKAPAHLWALDVLVETFPDVAVVWTHRNPLECTASICSMTEALMADREPFDPRTLGPAVLDFYATSLERALAVRERLDPARIADLRYDDFVADGVAAVRRLYAAFGLDWTPQLEARFEAHQRENPKGKHGAHDYDLARYGLSAADVRARYGAYAERFGLPID